MANPLFPSLMPKLVDSLWFAVDKSCDDSEQLQHEAAYKSWVYFSFVCMLVFSTGQDQGLIVQYNLVYHFLENPQPVSLQKVEVSFL